ncbi:MAG: response regulator [Patescibacteria group bacterium]
MNNPPLLLIIDDDREFQEVLVSKFKASGFQVQIANDGEEAVKKAKEFLPDLILMDVKMPKMDGVGALLKMKDDPQVKNIKVILLTAFGDPQQEIYSTDKRFAQELGAHEYLLKTQDLDDIVARVKASLAEAGKK